MAAEIYACEKLSCRKCNEMNWFVCNVNEKSKDQICKNCGKKYQIKCKNVTEKSYNNIILVGEVKTIGAEYNTTLKSIEEQIDYIIILYKKVNYNILGIIHIKSEDIMCDDIIPRAPLRDTAKRSGWQGCKLHFKNINYINSVF